MSEKKLCYDEIDTQFQKEFSIVDIETYIKFNLQLSSLSAIDIFSVYKYIYDRIIDISVNRSSYVNLKVKRYAELSTLITTTIKSAINAIKYNNNTQTDSNNTQTDKNTLLAQLENLENEIQRYQLTDAWATMGYTYLKAAEKSLKYLRERTNSITSLVEQSPTKSIDFHFPADKPSELSMIIEPKTYKAQYFHIGGFAGNRNIFIWSSRFNRLPLLSTSTDPGFVKFISTHMSGVGPKTFMYLEMIAALLNTEFVAEYKDNLLLCKKIKEVAHGINGTDEKTENTPNLDLFSSTNCVNYKCTASTHLQYIHSPTNTLKICSSCNRVNYCSKECQRADWPYHKLLCKTLQNVG